MNPLNSTLIFLGLIVILDLVPSFSLWHWAFKTIIEACRIHLLSVCLLLCFLISPVFSVFVLYWLYSLRFPRLSFCQRIQSLKISAFSKVEHEVIPFQNRKNESRPIVYLKSKSPQAPALIMVHGGAYKYGNCFQQMDTLNLFRELGYHVFSPSYSLVPKEWPQQKEDLEDFFSFIDKKFNPAFYVVGGRSAGVQLAVLLITQVIKSKPVKGFINFYGIADLWMLQKSFKGKNLLLFNRIMDQLFGKRKEDENFMLSISPLQLLTEQFPQTLIFHGTHDQIVDYKHSLLFKNRLDQLKVSCELVSFPRIDHVMEWNLYSPNGQKVSEKVTQFLKATLHS